MNLGLTRHRGKWWIADIDPKPHKRVGGPWAKYDDAVRNLDVMLGAFKLDPSLRRELVRSQERGKAPRRAPRPRRRYGNLAGHRIAISYSRIRPHNGSEGTYNYADEDTGWINESGVDMQPDAEDVASGMTSPVDKAVEFLHDEGVMLDRWAEDHPDEYETGHWIRSSRSDVQENRIFTLHGFSRDEQLAVLAGVRQASARRAARVMKAR